MIVKIIITAAILLTFTPHVMAQVSIPVDGNESYFCFWSGDKKTLLLDPNGRSLNFNVVNRKLSKQVTSQRAMLAAGSKNKSANIRAKIAQLQAIRKGVSICKSGNFGIEDGVADLPVNPNGLIAAAGTVVKSDGNAYCVVTTYILRSGKSNSGYTGYIFCKPNLPTPARTGFSFVFAKPGPPRVVILSQPRLTQDARLLLEGVLCTSASYIPCVNDIAKEFSETIPDMALKLTLSISGSLEKYEGLISCTSGC